MARTHECDNCGGIFPLLEDVPVYDRETVTVSFTYEPYAAEMFGDYEEMWLCDDCYGYRAECI